MADINGIKFSAGTSPTVYHTVTYTKSRPNNTQMTYNFTIKTTLQYSSSWIGTGSGYGLIATMTVNGTSKSATMKSESVKWNGVNTYTTNISVTCSSTTGNATQSVKFVVESTGALKSGTVSNSSYTVTSSALLPTKCTAPTSITVSPSPFEDIISLKWNGAKGGTNNYLLRVTIRYATSSNNSSWSSWKDLTTSTAGSTSISMASKVSRGYYVKFAIRAEGAAGSSYYSGWAYSGAIQRIAYTHCVAPTTINITSGLDSNNQFQNDLTIEWNDAKGGTNNGISGYDIRCAIYNSAGTDIENYYDLSGTKNGVTSIALTSSSGSKSMTLSWVTRGRKMEIQVRTKGSAGSSYYSKWKSSTTITRNLYSACVAPTTVILTSEKDLNGTTHSDIYETRVTINWDGAEAGANNNIKGYYIQVKLKDDTTGKWEDICYDLDGNENQATQIDTVLGNGTYIAYLDWIPRGRVATVIMKTLGEAGLSYYSDYGSYNVAIKRNSLPNAISSLDVSNLPSLEFSNGNDIILKWTKPKDVDNNIHHYRLQVSIGSQDDVIDYYGTEMLSNSAKVVWTDLIGNLSENTNAMTFTDPLTSNNYIVLNSSTVSHTVNSSNAYYGQVDNSNFADSNSLIQFRIRTVDVFGTYSDDNYIYSPIISRYDITGVTIGINGKWVNCQLFVGTNGEWIEQDVSAGINGSWIDADDGM